MALQVGDTFKTFQEFHEKLNRFQTETCTQFSLRTSEKLPAHIQCLALCPQARESCAQSNRWTGAMSAEVFQLYPEQRRFVADETDHQTLLSSRTMKTSEKRAIMERRHGGSLLSRDIYNQERKLNGTRVDSDGDVCQAILDDIVADGGFGMVAREESSWAFLLSAFQTRAMRDTLQRFPCVLVMDCTYKVNQYLYPLLTVMTVDEEGHGMPVFHSILARKDKQIMTQCLLLLSEQFDSSKTKCFVIDKDMAELAAIGSAFPEVPVNLCLFHISQAVERHLRKSLGRGPAALKAILESFMAHVVTESENEFAELTDTIKTIVPETVADYFQEQWWSKKHLWAACCHVNVMKLHATTTNTLESYHVKIKKTINEKLTLGNTLELLIRFNTAKITEARRLRLIAAVSKRYDAADSAPLERDITASMSRFGGEIVIPIHSV